MAVEKTKSPIPMLVVQKLTILVEGLLNPGLLLVFFFVLAGAARLYYLESVRVPSERQYRSALIARAFFYENSSSIPEWKKQVAEVSRKRADLLEPPVQEILTTGIYLLINQENLWIPRFLSSLFWILGGLSFYRIAKRMMSSLAVILVVAYYLFVPIGVLTSISFQPDSLMIMLFLFSLLAILRYDEQPSKTRLLLAAILSALAIVIRPLCLFTISGAFIAVMVYQKKSQNRFPGLDFLIFFSISLFPSLLYYSYGVLTGRYIAAQAEASFLPYLLLDKRYWTGWLMTAAGTIGVAPLVAGLLGFSITPKGVSRFFLGGLWIGYIVFCLAFTYQARYAKHYHLQLAVIVALSFGQLVDLLVNHLKRRSGVSYAWVLLTGAFLLVVLFTYRNIRQVLGAVIPVERVETAREIGEIVNHSTRAVYLAPSYGMPLEYYGELSGVYWPRREVHWAFQKPGNSKLSIEERFNAIQFSPEYFIITNFDEFNQYHTDLKAYLAGNFPVIAQSEEYLIYQMYAEH